MELIRKGNKLDGYDQKTDTGWFHDSLVKLITEYGFSARLKKFVPASELALDIHDGSFVLSSIDSESGGHLLLLYGYQMEKKGKLKGFWFNDSLDYREGGRHKFIEKRQFNKISTRRAIIVKA